MSEEEKQHIPEICFVFLHICLNFSQPFFSPVLPLRRLLPFLSFLLGDSSRGPPVEICSMCSLCASSGWVIIVTLHWFYTLSSIYSSLRLQLLFFWKESLCCELEMWSLNLPNRESLTKDAVWLHYGNCRMQCCLEFYLSSGLNVKISQPPLLPFWPFFLPLRLP